MMFKYKRQKSLLQAFLEIDFAIYSAFGDKRIRSVSKLIKTLPDQKFAGKFFFTLESMVIFNFRLVLTMIVLQTGNLVWIN
jgi:hypothetical protein